LSPKKELELLDVLLTTLSSQKLLEIVLKKIQSEGDLQLADLIKTFQETKGEISVPLSIFSTSLPPAEALCSFLRENKKLSYKEIAVLIGRNEKSVWAVCRRTAENRQKGKKGFPALSRKEHLLPISIFQDRSYSILESVLSYLRTTYRLSNPQIAALLKKSPNSIAVLMKRAREKQSPQRVQHGIQG